MISFIKHRINYSYLLANSGSKGAGIGNTGRSLVLIPLCCLDMCECSEFLDFATVPHNTHRYPGHIVCLSSRCVRNVCAERYIFPHFGHGRGSVALTLCKSKDRRDTERNSVSYSTIGAFLCIDNQSAVCFRQKIQLYC